MNGGKSMWRLPLILAIVAVFGVLATLVGRYIMEDDFSDTASISVEVTRDGQSYCVEVYSSTSGKSEMKVKNCGKERVKVEPAGQEAIEVDSGAEAVVTELSINILSPMDLLLGSASLAAASLPA